MQPPPFVNLSSPPELKQIPKQNVDNARHISSFESDMSSQSFGSSFAGFMPSTATTNKGFENQDMMMNVAGMYAEQFAQKSKNQISQMISASTLKYYFAVDNAYVGKKLLILLFPFFHRDWTIRYNTEDEPIAPRFDINASDLYIPVMAFVTYIFVCGLVLGVHDIFSPEQLGIIASSAMAWLVIENLIIFITKFIMGISRVLRFYDTLAYSGYKYVSMIISLILYLIGGRTAYYITIAYCSIAIAFFLVRSVKVEVLHGVQESDAKNRKLYLLLYISLTQPFIIYWLTSNLTL